MTLPSQVFRRVRAAGWLILSGSIPGSEVGAGWIEQLLGHANLSKPVFWLETDVDTVEASEFLNEIEELIEVPLPSLLDEKGFGEMIISRGGREEVVYAYQYGKHTIWGATARILKQFLDLISSLR